MPIKKLLIILFIILALLCLLLLIYPMYSLKKVIIISSLSSLNGLKSLEGINLLFMDMPMITQLLKESNLQVKDLTLHKIYPHTLQLNITPRIPIAEVLTSNGSVFIDDEGIITASYAPTGKTLPVIDWLNIRPSKTSKADWRVIKAISLIKMGSVSSFNIEKITINDEQNLFQIKTSDGTNILINTKDDAQFIATSLQLIVERFRIEGKNISSINLRFDKPIITLINGEIINSK